MAGGSKKKKKPASNPARGFATTSIQSNKSKIVAEEDEKAQSTRRPASASANKGVSHAHASTAGISKSTSQSTSQGATASPEGQRELHELSPEELEKQLETSELQQFVQDQGSKVRKESSRQSSRLQTDKRVLRNQADYLAIKDWLSDDVIHDILGLIKNEHLQEQLPGQRPVVPVGDDLVSKLWTLRLCLQNLEFPTDRIHDVLAHIIENPPVYDHSGLIWGLAGALEWLSLNFPEIPGYDFQKAKAMVVDMDDDECGSNDPSRSLTNIPATERKETRPDANRSIPQMIPDFDVSDIDSDLEPDELLATYLRTKARLYEVNPDSVSTSKKKKSHARAGAPVISTPDRVSLGETKLRAKLEKIQSDVLFDQREADMRWSVQEIDLAREAAERKRLQLPSVEPEPADVNLEADRVAQEVLQEAEAMDGDDMLSGMFDALPGVTEASASQLDGQDATSVTIRDFGRLTGMSPKRILEETCKSRDNQVKVTYRLVSPTTYASRHSVAINWTKDQEIVNGDFLTSVDVHSKPRITTVTSKSIAVPDIAQSEAYIATVALYLIFSDSPKEEKSHMKLPPAFRDLWGELSRLQQDTIDSADRETVKELRSLIKEHQSLDEDGDEEEVVFSANSRRRLDGASGRSTPLGQSITSTSANPEISLALRSMWDNKTSLPSYQRMLKGRMLLPMFQFKDAALEVIQKHQVTILCGETGCGKSTQLPAFILEHELSQGRPCKIYCTEPRRISAVSLAQRVSEELGEQRGDVGTSRSLVGYAIRLESHTTAETKLVYATVGIVLRMLERPDGISDITHLVIDEVHERSIDTDFLLIVLRSLMLKRPELKVVLMSATVDAQKFSNYLDGAPVVTVPGRTFPVQAKFLEDAIEMTGHTNEGETAGGGDADDDFEGDGSSQGHMQLPSSYSKTTKSTMASYDEYRIDYNLIVKLIHKVAFDPQLQQFSKATLVFLPGIGEIRQLNDLLTSDPSFSQRCRVYPLHSSFTSEDQQAAFDVPPPGTRKIVLATNIAETGITIPDVTCVIDTGKHKEMRFDERRQLSKLVLSFIAKANAKQRRGRAGRVQEGICFHLFTKYRHEQLMAEQQTPEMLRLSLQELAMRVKICKLGDIEHTLSQALDPPSTKNIRRAIDALVEVNALTTQEELTPLGSQIARLPLDAQLGKFVLLSSIFGCLDFGLTAAAALTSKSPFLSPMHAKNKADTVRLGFKRGNSDLLTLYNAYCAWRKVCQTPGLSEYQFCNKNFLSPQNLANIEDLKGQLVTALVDAGFVSLDAAERTALSKIRPGARQRNFVQLPAIYTRAEDDDTIASSVLAWSFYPKIVKQEGKGWRNVANNQALGLHPTSVNKHGLPAQVKLLSFYSIMQSNSRFTNAQETTPVPEMALVLMAGDATFHMHAGVIVIDGNRLRFKVGEWKIMMILRTLRARLRDAVARQFKLPGKEASGKNRAWLEILARMFEVQRKARTIG